MGKIFGFFNRRWFQIILGGLVLFFASEQVLKITGNPNFFPTVLLLGAFIIPIAFVAYFYEEERATDKGLHGEAPLTIAGICFLVGGATGVIVAGILEYATLKTLSVAGLFGVGIIEEGAKLIFPVALFLRGRYKSEADGLLFGVAAGMGFAALETMGYGLVTLVTSNGDIASLENVLFFRGLLSPASHAAWTGYICATLWRERERRGYDALSSSVAVAFFVAVLLHAAWDTINSISGGTSGLLVIVFLGDAFIVGAGLVLLFRKLREARRAVEIQKS